MAIHDEKANGIVIPPEIAAVGFDFARDISKIWQVQQELPIEEIPIEELVWHLELPFFWGDDKKPFSVKPIDVINNPKQFEYRYGRIMGVDANFPIAIIFWKDRWEILDGLHRLCQLYISGAKTVRVNKVPKDWIDRIKPE